MFKKSFIVFIMVIALAFTGNAFAQTANSESNSGATAIGGGAATEQNQGQGQEQFNSLEQFNNSFNSAPTRGFAIPNDVAYGPVINFFGQPLPSANMQDINELLTYGHIFSEDVLRDILAGFKTGAKFKVANSYKMPPEPAKIRDMRWIMIVVKKGKLDNAFFKGYITSWADGKTVTMAEVMFRGALEALEKGCNVYQVTAQGAHRDVMTSGWGIGFNHTYAHISGGGQRESNVSSGGTGYSSAQAGMRDLPWLQGFGLIVPDEILKPAIEARLGAEETK